MRSLLSRVIATPTLHLHPLPIFSGTCGSIQAKRKASLVLLSDFPPRFNLNTSTLSVSTIKTHSDATADFPSAQSLLESPAPLPELTGPPTSKSLDGRHSAPVHDAPDLILQGTLTPLTSLTNDIAASTSPEANNTRVGTIAPSPTRSSASHRDNRFPDHMCCGDSYERCRKRYRYQKAWRKHFEKKHLNNLHMRGPLNDAPDYLVCPHCPVKVHKSNKKNLMKHLWADHTRSN
jgi:hypothetical protein